MLTPIGVRDLLAEASRLRVMKIANDDIWRSAKLDKEKEEGVPSGYPDNLR
jgi:hypothetical protein